jgi:hypothetical protein
MAKKQKTIEVEEPQMQEVTVDGGETEVTVTPTKEQLKELYTSDDTWEIKDRMYVLRGNKKPLSRIIRAAGIYYFDEELGYERELKYCENQRTCFVDEMKGEQRLSHIIFRNGMLPVPREKVVLQKLLSLYHPNRDGIFFELKPEVQAASQVDIIELEIEALNAARNLDIDMAEAVLRTEVGSKVSEMSSKEIKRDLLLYAKLSLFSPINKNNGGCPLGQPPLLKLNIMSNNLKEYMGRPRGLGDTIANFTQVTGLNNLARMGAKAMGKKDCGCGKRQEVLNKAFPYKK